MYNEYATIKMNKSTLRLVLKSGAPTLCCVALGNYSVATCLEWRGQYTLLLSRRVIPASSEGGTMMQRVS